MTKFTDVSEGRTTSIFWDEAKKAARKIWAARKDIILIDTEDGSRMLLRKVGEIYWSTMLNIPKYP